MKSFQALFIEKEADNTSLHFRETTIDNLPENEVTIEVHYSGINYKDGLAVLPDGKIVSEYPFIMVLMQVVWSSILNLTNFK